MRGEKRGKGEPGKAEGARRRRESCPAAVSSLNHPHLCVLHDVGPTGPTANRNHYVVSPDSQRFPVNQLVGDPAKVTISVVVNLAARLPR